MLCVFGPKYRIEKELSNPKRDQFCGPTGTPCLTNAHTLFSIPNLFPWMIFFALSAANHRNVWDWWKVIIVTIKQIEN